MKVACLFVVFLGIAAAAPAQVVIDDFTTGADSIGASSGTSYYQQTGGMLGGFRGEELDVIQNPFSTMVTVDLGAGNAVVSEGSGLAANVAFGYGFNASADHSTYTAFDLAADLLPAVQFTVTVAYAENSFLGAIELNNDPTQTFYFTVNADSNAETYGISFADFSNVNFSDVHQIALGFTPSAGTDFVIGLGGFSTTPSPEPATIAFLGLGAVGLLARRKRH